MNGHILTKLLMCDTNQRNISHIFLLFEQIPMEAPWDAPKAKEWDSMTVKEFLDKNVWTK